MTHEEALKIIEISSLEQIGKLSSINLSTLTDRFRSEAAIKAILAKASTLELQRKVWELINFAHDELYAGCMICFEEIDLKLSLGIIITSSDAQEPAPTPAPPDTSNLEAELEALRAKVKRLEAENNQLREEPNASQSPEGAPIDTEGHGAVRLELVRQLMDKAGAQWQTRGNKVIAAQLMAAITGLALKTCRNHLSDPIVKHTEHQEIILDTNSKLKALGIEITL